MFNSSNQIRRRTLDAFAPIKYFFRLTFFVVLLASCTPHTQMQRICAQCVYFPVATALGPVGIWAQQAAEQKNTSQQGGTIHVYLENDGAAYSTPTQVAANPSLRADFLALRLMQQDTRTRLYLSRPCYGFAVNNMPATCHPRYWTQARYSAEVIKALSEALDQAKTQLNRSADKIILIGHSGGGSLALLIAQQRWDVQGVVTLAGNLDTTAWTKLHGYGPLDQSLNPFTQPLLPPSIKRWHFAGDMDKNIPPSLIWTSCQRDASAQCQTLTGVSHTQGWLAQWPKILMQIDH